MGGCGGARGHDKLAWTACSPGVKITRVGGKISWDNLPSRGASCPGGGRGQHKLLHRFSRCDSSGAKALVAKTSGQGLFDICLQSCEGQIQRHCLDMTKIVVSGMLMVF